jgi:hypothetical protein
MGHRFESPSSTSHHEDTECTARQITAGVLGATLYTIGGERGTRVYTGISGIFGGGLWKIPRCNRVTPCGLTRGEGEKSYMEITPQSASRLSPIGR